MKTNLDSLFKTNKNLESEGVWFMLTDEAGFLVRRFGGGNAQRVKQAMAKYYKPYARQVESGTVPADKERDILIRAFTESCLVDWQGIEIDGQLVPFSVEAAIGLFKEMSDLFDSIYSYASSIESYKEELGNS